METVQQIIRDEHALADEGELLSAEATQLLADFERRSAKLENMLADETQAPAGESAAGEPQAGSADLEDLRSENSTLRDLSASSDARARELEAEAARLRGLLEDHEISSAPPLPAEDRQLCDAIGIDADTFIKLKKSFSGEQRSEQAPQDQAKKAFITKVDLQARGWRDIRQKPEFAAFCNTRPGGTSGPSYLDMLKTAAQTFDADTTAEVYNAFKAQPAAPRRPSREAADSRSKGGDGAPVAVEIWTPEKIEQFSKDVHQGKIKPGSEKYKKLRASYDNWLSNLTVAG